MVRGTAHPRPQQRFSERVCARARRGMQSLRARPGSVYTRLLHAPPAVVLACRSLPRGNALKQELERQAQTAGQAWPRVEVRVTLQHHRPERTHEAAVPTLQRT